VKLVQAQKGEEQDGDHMLDFREQLILPCFLFIFSRLLTLIPSLSPCPLIQRIFDPRLICLPEVPVKRLAYDLQGVILLHALCFQLSVVLLHDFLDLIGVIALVDASLACLLLDLGQLTDTGTVDLPQLRLIESASFHVHG
jgi:hypothetical protein